MPDSRGNETDTERRIRLYEAGIAAAKAIAHCALCDSEGYRGGQVCDHEDHTEAAKRGMAMVRKVMGWKP